MRTRLRLRLGAEAGVGARLELLVEAGHDAHVVGPLRRHALRRGEAILEQRARDLVRVGVRVRARARVRVGVRVT